MSMGFSFHASGTFRIRERFCYDPLLIVDTLSHHLIPPSDVKFLFIFFYHLVLKIVNDSSWEYLFLSDLMVLDLGANIIAMAPRLMELLFSRLGTFWV